MRKYIARNMYRPTVLFQDRLLFYRNCLPYETKILCRIEQMFWKCLIFSMEPVILCGEHTFDFGGRRDGNQTEGAGSEGKAEDIVRRREI